MSNILELNKVSKRYPGGRWALERISFTLAAGEMTYLTGHSGAGKTTLLKLISLIERHTQGQILFNGTDLKNITQNATPFFRRQLGFVFQDPMLLADRTVFNNVALPLVVSGASQRDINKKVPAALDKVGLLKKEAVFPNDLSVGEQQRIGIARAIVNKPPLILADEPTGNLDSGLAYEIMKVFQQLNNVGVTVIVATHNRNLIEKFPYQQLILHQGKLL
jgi:cell division transport system ATP-binding protein